MFVRIGSNFPALASASAVCHSELVAEEDAFIFDRFAKRDVPRWMHQSRHPFICVGIIKIGLDASQSFTRTPHQVAVFLHRNTYWLVWDGYKEGFGLQAFIGQDARHLKVAYAIEATKITMASRGWRTAAQRTSADETITLEFAHPMAQRTIKVRIDQKGNSTVTTEGFTGKACQDATRQLEAALGTVVSDTPTLEMHKPTEQFAQVSNG